VAATDPHRKEAAPPRGDRPSPSSPRPTAEFPTVTEAAPARAPSTPARRRGNEGRGRRRPPHIDLGELLHLGGGPHRPAAVVATRIYRRRGTRRQWPVQASSGSLIDARPHGRVALLLPGPPPSSPTATSFPRLLLQGARSQLPCTMREGKRETAGGVPPLRDRSSGYGFFLQMGDENLLETVLTFRCVHESLNYKLKHTVATYIHSTTHFFI
jgi:hypothetical protein